MNNTEKEMKLYHVRRKLEGLAYFASVCSDPASEGYNNSSAGFALMEDILLDCANTLDELRHHLDEDIDEAQPPKKSTRKKS